MATARHQRSYVGSRPEPLEWSQLLGIFQTLFGENAESLPRYPEVIGGVWARWQTADSAEHDADHLHELERAYAAGETALVHFSDLGASDFMYWPGREPPTARLTLRGDPDFVETALDVVRELFPLQRKVVFITWGADHARRVALQLREILKDRFPEPVEVFVSDVDVRLGSDPGKAMFQDNLLVCAAHLVVLTRQGYERPWVIWEAGASWGRGVGPIPLFVDVSPNEVGGPLAALVQGLSLEDRPKLDAVIAQVGELVQANPPTPLSDDEFEALLAVASSDP